jgi:hypothetical protein
MGEMQTPDLEAIIQHELIISTILAISIVAILAWLGDWAGIRVRRRQEDYWNSHSLLACPCCGQFYEPSSRVGDWSATCGGGDGWVFHCKTCGEDAFFKAEQGPPTFEGFGSQPRRCLECGDLFFGKPDATCPTCAQKRHKIEPAP